MEKLDMGATDLSVIYLSIVRFAYVLSGHIAVCLAT